MKAKGTWEISPSLPLLRQLFHHSSKMSATDETEIYIFHTTKDKFYIVLPFKKCSLVAISWDTCWLKNMGLHTYI